MMFTNHSNESRKENSKYRHKIIRSSLKKITDIRTQQDGQQEALAKFISKSRSPIPPRMNNWKRNSTPKPFALSIFRNWNVSYSPIQDSEESPQISIYQSVLSSVHSSKVSRDFVFKSALSAVQSSEKSECSPSSDYHFQSASEASDDSSVVQCKRPRVNYDDEDVQESKKFRFSNLHGKPVKNLFEIFAAVEEGDITV